MPDWYPSLRAARYAGVPWTAALGCPWSEAMEECCLIAERAEGEAKEYLEKQAAKDRR